MNNASEIMVGGEQLKERPRELALVTPLVDIYENDSEILLFADMPGVTKEEITVNIDNGKLEITGTRRLTGETGSVTLRELTDVEYRRSFSVPQTIAVSEVNATLKDGVLQLHLPKSEQAKPRLVEIKVG
ncbi:MAG: Hsp20/alpha crystallin family protein [Desulfopila sp.]